MRGVLTLAIGIAIGVWIGDNKPNLADTVRDATDKSIVVAESVLSKATEKE